MKIKRLLIRTILLFGVFAVTSPLTADEKEKNEQQERPLKLQADGMDNKHLEILIKRLDKEAKGESGHWQFKIEGQDVYVVTDENADRMRIIAPIIQISELDTNILFRLLQANFDSALDARYSIAKGVLWSAFIHPLSPLSDKEFLIGVGQVVNLVATYGTTFSSGALIFQGGDSQDIQRRQLIDKLLDKGLVT